LRLDQPPYTRTVGAPIAKSGRTLGETGARLSEQGGGGECSESGGGSCNDGVDCVAHRTILANLSAKPLHEQTEARAVPGALAGTAATNHGKGLERNRARTFYAGPVAEGNHLTVCWVLPVSQSIPDFKRRPVT
jgi:hypothetical protein